MIAIFHHEICVSFVAAKDARGPAQYIAKAPRVELQFPVALTSMSEFAIFNIFPKQKVSKTSPDRDRIIM